MSSGGVLRRMHDHGQTEAVRRVLDGAVMNVTDVRFWSPAASNVLSFTGAGRLGDDHYWWWPPLAELQCWIPALFRAAAKFLR